MILDILVSKYLDGDLSIEEDAELRQQISGDPSAKEAFDAAILIHIAMACADPIEVPQDVHKETLAAVFARIEASAAPLELVTVPRTMRLAGPLAMLVSLLLIVSTPLGDLFVPGVLNKSSLSLANPVASEQRTELPRNVVELAKTIPVVESTPAQGIGQPLEDTDQFVSQLPVSESEVVANSSLFVEEEPLPEPQWVAEPPATGMALVLGTFFGTGMGSSSPSVSNITIVAQSIGYRVSSTTVVGLEFGSLSYANAVSTTANISNRDPLSIVSTRGNGEDGNVSKLEPAPPDSYTKATHTSSQTLTSLWGSAFIQQSVFRTPFGEIMARAGLGVDEVGVMGFGRLTGQFRIQSWLSLSIGAEARSASFAQTIATKTGNGSSLGFLLSAIAGIQITP